ncbi:hypothetical protein M947_11625 [Sulfurimonas hongkongensis]|uniref:Uncharacterized protein n=1 Tax=Sulfurimonas hongkongensis TaxID=1172190 RepID=T0IZQ6_9BACT|nr:hypothetical protein M947_11625 [Sulfurimonas hongkongensis]
MAVVVHFLEPRTCSGLLGLKVTLASNKFEVPTRGSDKFCPVGGSEKLD